MVAKEIFKLAGNMAKNIFTKENEDLFK